LIDENFRNEGFATRRKRLKLIWGYVLIVGN